MCIICCTITLLWWFLDFYFAKICCVREVFWQKDLELNFTSSGGYCSSHFREYTCLHMWICRFARWSRSNILSEGNSSFCCKMTVCAVNCYNYIDIMIIISIWCSLMEIDQFHHDFHNSTLFNLRFSICQNCSFQNGNFTNCLRMSLQNIIWCQVVHWFNISTFFQWYSPADDMWNINKFLMC